MLIKYLCYMKVNLTKIIFKPIFAEKQGKTMEKLSLHLLKTYETKDFVIHLKAKFILYLCITLLIILPTIIIYTIILNWMTPSTRLIDSLNIILPVVAAFFVIACTLYLLTKGHFSISSHLIICICFMTSWVIMFVDNSSPINRLDSIAFVFGVLTMTPLVVSKRKMAIIAYSLINIAMLFIFMNISRNQLGIPDNVIRGFIGDNTISIIFICIISYNVFSINKKALDKATHELSERKQAEKALRESEKRYRLLANNIRDVIWVMDMNLKTTFVTESVMPLRGFTPDEVLSQPIEKSLTPKSFELAMAAFEKELKIALSSNKDPEHSVTLELEQYCKDGSIVWVEVQMTYLYDPSDNPIEILGVSRNITERKKTEELMIQSEKMITVGGLAAGMAHEINNPLAGVVQNIQIVQNRLTPDLPKNNQVAIECGTDIKTIMRYMEKRGLSSSINMVKESGFRAAKIVENMLSFSRKGEVELLPHDLVKIFDKAIDLAGKDYSLIKQYDFRHIEIIREFENHLPKVPCVSSKLQQVILNLLKNGAQAMVEKFEHQEIKNNNEKPQFILRLKKKKNMLHIEVQDNGPGIPEDVRQRIFEPFFTTKAVGMGTGLGLFVSYFIITQNHNGQMTVESTQGIGTLFTIKLPLKINL